MLYFKLYVYRMSTAKISKLYGCMNSSVGPEKVWKKMVQGIPILFSGRGP